MKAVLEEVESGIACFIPDDQNDAIYLNEKDLPKNIKLGQLYDITFNDQGKIEKIKELSKEQLERHERLKNKREQLKKRK